MRGVSFNGDLQAAIVTVDLLEREKVELQRQLLKEIAKVEEPVSKFNKCFGRSVQVVREERKFSPSKVRIKAKNANNPTHEMDVAVSINPAATVKPLLRPGVLPSLLVRASQGLPQT